MSVALPLPNRCPVAYPLEIFKSDPASGAFGAGDDGLADAVVLLLAESGFLARQLPELFLGPLGSLSLAGLATGLVLAADSFHDLTRMYIAVRIDRNVDNAEIDTQKIHRLDRGVLGHLHRAIEKELASAIDQVDLALHAVEPLTLVFAIDQGENHPAAKNPETDFIQSFETENAIVVADRRSRLERRTPGLVPLEAFNCFADRSDRHLSGQTEPLSDLAIGELVDTGLREYAMLETKFRGERRGLVEPLHRGQQGWLLIESGQQLQLERKLHAGILGSIPS